MEQFIPDYPSSDSNDSVDSPEEKEVVQDVVKELNDEIEKLRGTNSNAYSLLCDLESAHYNFYKYDYNFVQQEITGLVRYIMRYHINNKISHEHMILCEKFMLKLYEMLDNR